MSYYMDKPLATVINLYKLVRPKRHRCSASCDVVATLILFLYNTEVTLVEATLATMGS
jgi:hypothetical protein